MIEVLFFGQLTDITRAGSLSWQACADTETLVSQMKEKYPGLSGAKFILAVDNQMITSAVSLKPGSRVAFMPPFSGG